MTGTADLGTVRRILRPDPELESRIKAFIGEQLGGVLPSDPKRGLDWYYDSVVLGGRALEAFDVLCRHRGPEGLPVVDIGSGLGTFVLLANRFGMPALGVEPGQDELRLAEERAAALGMPVGRLFRPGIGERVPIGDGEASAVLLHDVLEHVEDWRLVLAECRRVLAPGGVLYLKGPSYSMRFVEPHYRVPWLPLLPRPLARRYLAMLGRDTQYLEHVGYRRRGAVLRELRALGLRLSFPRVEKVADPASVNRIWVRRIVSAVRRSEGDAPRYLELLAENPLQSTIDVIARRPLDYASRSMG